MKKQLEEKSKVMVQEYHSNYKGKEKHITTIRQNYPLALGTMSKKHTGKWCHTTTIYFNHINGTFRIVRKNHSSGWKTGVTLLHTWEKDLAKYLGMKVKG